MIFSVSAGKNAQQGSGQDGNNARAAHELSARASNREVGEEHLHLPLHCYPTSYSIPNTDGQKGFIPLAQNPAQIPAKLTQVPWCAATTSLQAQRVLILKAPPDCSRFHPNRNFPLQTSKHNKVMST